MADTAIEWAEKVWNPVVGCSKAEVAAQLNESWQSVRAKARGRKG